MKKILIYLIMPLLYGVLAGCTAFNTRAPASALYDLGPSQATPGTAGPVIAISIAEITPSAWLDSPLIFYRLGYANSQQPRSYAQHRWLAPPAQLLSQRLKARIAQAGGIAASASSGPINLSMLSIEADDFTHTFDAPDRSYGTISLRASVYHGRTLIAQKSFAERVPAPSHDAEGGVRALAIASDNIIHGLLGWLATLPLKR